ncbi:MAG: LipL32 family surface lipoprotein [Planctomycetota bacterium]
MTSSIKLVSCVAVVAALAMIQGCGGDKLGTFGADFGAETVMGKTVRIPYLHTVKYFGYVAPGAEPDEVIDGKKYYFLYLWVPLAAPELGIRMMSPVGDLVPAEGDIKAPNWEEGAADKTNYFDTYITLERSLDITSIEEIEAKVGATTWTKYAEVDDSSEMPKNPGGSRYNSLMRVSTDINDPLKALVFGLYRIGFTTYKVGEVQGTFYAEVGAPIELPGTVIAKDIPSLMKALTAPAEGEVVPAEGETAPMAEGETAPAEVPAEN